MIYNYVNSSYYRQTRIEAILNKYSYRLDIINNNKNSLQAFIYKYFRMSLYKFAQVSGIPKATLIAWNNNLNNNKSVKLYSKSKAKVIKILEAYEIDRCLFPINLT